MKPSRQIKQVLLMVDYGPDDPESGNVYDLTAQTVGLLGERDRYRSAKLSVEINAWSDGENFKDTATELKYSGYSYAGIGKHTHCHDTPHLADVLNMLAPPSDRVLALQAEADEVKAKAQAAEDAVTAARMEQLAGMRMAHPVARLTTVGELMGSGQLLTEGVV